MTVDSHCSVAISSLSQPQCPPSSTDMPAVEKSSDQEPAQVSDAIIGGVVAVVIVLIIAITIAIVVIIVVLILKNRRGEVSLKNNSDKKSGSGDIHTSTNEAYGKVGGGQREEGYELVDISHGEPPPPPAKLEEMYEVPLSSAPPPSQPLPPIPLPHTDADTVEKDTAVYDVIPGDI
ncbi:hypothetical protein GBAR_LOCUS20828 [Geodia barretti]|uniref:Uncharacterized protein n=1 Tax=Geodia barretti TaxID=519541 RepID=A0AA35SW86_GEOBA|nr:hypothetical protein GBAR_LOCUS20828 [Geodia barretti]